MMPDNEELVERVAKAIERVRFAPFINDGGPSKMDIALARAAIEAIRIEQLHKEVERLTDAASRARDAIASLPEDALGMAQIAFGTPGVDVYPIRDELLAEIDTALRARSGEHNG